MGVSLTHKVSSGHVYQCVLVMQNTSAVMGKWTLATISVTKEPSVIFPSDEIGQQNVMYCSSLFGILIYIV